MDDKSSMKKFLLISTLVVLASAIVPALAVGMFGKDAFSRKGMKWFEKKEEVIEESGTPKVVLEHMEFDFGRLDPNTKEFHEFEIENEGDGNLRLKKAGHSCDCIKAQLNRTVVPPGESAVARIMWDTRFATDAYRHHILIRTNDPEKPEFRLRIKGMVAQKITSDPRLVNLPPLSSVSPKSSGNTLVFSQLYEDFKIESVTSTLTGAKTSFSLADKQELGLRNAKSGYWVGGSVDYKDQMESFYEKLIVKYRPKEKGSDEYGKPDTMVVQIGGTVKGRLRLFGDDRLSSAGEISLGNLSSKGESIEFTVLVDDEYKELSIKRAIAKPSYIKASMKPFGTKGKEKGMYRLRIELPEGECSGVYTKENPAVLRIEFEHPTLKPLRLILLYNTLDTIFTK